MAKILTAITTYGTPAYVHLGLEHFRRHSSGLTDVIVCDDHSEDPRLRPLCESYGAPLLTLPEKAFCSDVGDVRLSLMALEYAKEHGYTHLLKLSRSMILKRSPFSSLDWLIEQSGGWTFTNRETRINCGFRTHAICLHTDAWYRLIPEIEAKLPEWERDGYAPGIMRVEPYIHMLARREQPTSEKYLRWVEMHPRSSEDNGYVVWDWPGDNWHQPPEHVLWYSHVSPEGYNEEARKVGLFCYTDADFDKKRADDWRKE